MSLDALKAEADVDEPVAAYRHLFSRLYGEDMPGRRPGGGGLRPGRAGVDRFIVEIASSLRSSQ